MSAKRATATAIRRPMAGIAIDTGQLARLRTEKLWSRGDLAARAGISLTAVDKIENGERRPRPETLRKLCGALGCEPGALLAPH